MSYSPSRWHADGERARNDARLRRRRGALGAGALVLAMTMTACSGGGGGGSTAGTGDPTAAADLSGVTLEVEASWSGAEQENFQAVLDAFTSQTGATVNYTSFGDNGATVIGTQIEGGNPPDVAVISQPALLRQLAADGDIVPLSDDTLATVTENYAQDWVDLATIDGQTYGVWFKAANKSTVWYNTDVYDAAGASVPTTWEDFLAQLQLIADAGYSGISIGADVGWPLTDWFENVYLRTAGPEKYDQLTNHEIPWTDASVTEALEVLAELFGNDQLVEPGAVQRTHQEAVVEVFGAEPKAGTYYEGDFVAGNITDDGNSVVGQNALVYTFPSVNGSGPAVVGGGDVAVGFNDDAGTQALLEFLASPEAAEVWVPKGGLTSPNKNVDTALYPDDVSRQIAEALANAETFRFDMSDMTPSAFGGTVGQGFFQAMIDFLADPADVAGTQEALEAAAVAAYAD